MTGVPYDSYSCWDRYEQLAGKTAEKINRFCYHQPFTNMSRKAHRHLMNHRTKNGYNNGISEDQIIHSQCYNRVIGNTYAASLFIGLLSLLDYDNERLAGNRIGLFSYGSGCTGAFYAGTVQDGYRDALDEQGHYRMLTNRIRLSYPDYIQFYHHGLPRDGSSYRNQSFTTGLFRLAGIDGHKREYEINEGATESLCIRSA